MAHLTVHQSGGLARENETSAPRCIMCLPADAILRIRKPKLSCFNQKHDGDKTDGKLGNASGKQKKTTAVVYEMRGNHGAAYHSSGKVLDTQIGDGKEAIWAHGTTIYLKKNEKG